MAVLPNGAIETKRLGEVLLAIVALLIVRVDEADAGAKIISPGDGIELAHVGQAVPEEHIRESLVRENVFLTSENGVVTSVLILNQAYHTRLGVSVGDTSSTVVRAYGRVEVASVPIVKGDRIIGNSGKTMLYPGLSFYLTGDVVSAIAVHGEK